MGCGCGKPAMQRAPSSARTVSAPAQRIAQSTGTQVVKAQSVPSGAPINKPVSRPQV
jgi:hypothetical protein